MVSVLVSGEHPECSLINHPPVDPRSGEITVNGLPAYHFNEKRPLSIENDDALEGSSDDCSCVPHDLENESIGSTSTDS